MTRPRTDWCPPAWLVAWSLGLGAGSALHDCGTPPPTELVCACDQAEWERWSEHGRLHLRCVCPGSEGR